jgi:hypothetical protein
MTGGYGGWSYRSALPWPAERLSSADSLQDNAGAKLGGIRFAIQVAVVSLTASGLF